MRHCIRCDQWKDESEFSIRDSERVVLRYVCRDCQKEQGSELYANNSEGNKSAWVHPLWEILLQVTDSGSVNCGSNPRPQPHLWA